MVGTDEPGDFDDREAFAAVTGRGSVPGYGDMRDFVDTVTDDAVTGRLGVVMQGREAFHRFKDTLLPERGVVGGVADVLERASVGRARWWLADAGPCPAADADKASQ